MAEDEVERLERENTQYRRALMALYQESIHWLPPRYGVRVGVFRQLLSSPCAIVVQKGRDGQVASITVADAQEWADWAEQANLEWSQAGEGPTHEAARDVVHLARQARNKAKELSRR